MNNLIRKYNIPGPRYTSYPTVPFWDNDNFSKRGWVETFQRAFDESNEEEGISIYIHLPFCESLCTFCACNKRITKQHSVEIPYIDTVLKEWKMYVDLFSSRPKIKEIHLGGGTPTFFSPENLKKLIDGIFVYADIAEGHEFSLEGHPNNTTKEHMQVLYDLGFKRISYGVQDYDPKVQKAINRVQSFEAVKKATEEAREIGFTSVSHDLIFGLPHQTMSGMIRTIQLTRELNPDRISFYSYAHVPWVKGVGQRGFQDEDLPSPEVKRALYEEGKKMFEDMGYFEIGMDHFALEHDSMYQSMKNHTLHRNFMGYSSSKTKLMIGLGVSSISDSWYSFAQNEKTVEEYEASINRGELSVFKGHILTDEDLIVRRHILNLMCNLQTSWKHPEQKFDGLSQALYLLEDMVKDGLIEIKENELIVNEKGRPFVRNVCMAFDLHLLRNAPETRIFSMTI
ncbi:Oxygen-independent coproporphyrinogen-III oxidase [Weeksella virosa]|uniref:oxygen-independent coproporphyrinogen III oxidase n=1 Tax=Weeksella virosa TaxID=1014 RepID=UPI000E00F4B8|nr:oxygen-independent coproporphyrinogen III oxidase [Weeksella virosa]SUP54370.1 Oxygen-independent coproporphyrinogen-III oxidase [Weeksella virosa]